MDDPGLLRKAANFAREAAHHFAAGRPQATDEQIDERFAICEACELYARKGVGRGECRHERCGCQLKASYKHGINKLRWAEQACPIGKW